MESDDDGDALAYMHCTDGIYEVYRMDLADYKYNIELGFPDNRPIVDYYSKQLNFSLSNYNVTSILLSYRECFRKKIPTGRFEQFLINYVGTEKGLHIEGRPLGEFPEFYGLLLTARLSRKRPRQTDVRLIKIGSSLCCNHYHMSPHKTNLLTMCPCCNGTCNTRFCNS